MAVHEPYCDCVEGIANLPISLFACICLQVAYFDLKKSLPDILIFDVYLKVPGVHSTSG